ncbi:hypothetical protein B0H14DRAFT_3439399 [Mycena olivaceomarginata]|nr:hypothetical protein B0H14DRAFT_3439399 [Mycena olivaceomarginata]
MSSMSSRSHSSHRTSKPAKTSPAVFCPHCDPCPTCGNGLQPEKPASTAPVDPGPAAPVPTPRTSNRERILPAIPISLLFTLFLLEAHMQGGWHHLLIPYICVLSPLPMDELSDLIIGLSLTDPGPNVRQQPSKLFSTRDEFQDLHAPHIPTSSNAVPLSVAQESIQADLLLEVRERVQTARESLLGIDLLFADNNDYNSMRLAVDAAAQVVISAGDEILAEVRELDKRIDCLGAQLPPEVVIPETEPFPYDAAHVHANPVGHLDLLAK